MFEDSMLESNGTLSRRPWATAFSFAAQIVLGATFVLISLHYTETLPRQRVMSVLEAPAPPASAPQPRTDMQPVRPSNQPMPDVLTPPSEIPRSIAMVPNETPPSGSIGFAGGGPDGKPLAPPDGVSELPLSPPVNLPRLAAQKLRVSSGVAQGMSICQVRPEYPPLAQQTRIQGTVVLQATIGKDGLIENLHVVSGHPLLIQAAIDAVKQWRYRPYSLNAEPLEVETSIIVNFTLGSN